MKESQFNAHAIRALAEILKETDLTEVEYEENGVRIYLAKNPPQQTVAMPSAPAIAAAAPVAPIAPAAVLNAPSPQYENALKSPMVGMVYLAPSPGELPFVKVGDVVTKGQTLLIVEAMKVMNPIKAPQGGTITHILVPDATPVEYHQPLIVIE